MLLSPLRAMCIASTRTMRLRRLSLSILVPQTAKSWEHPSLITRCPCCGGACAMALLCRWIARAIGYSLRSEDYLRLPSGLKLGKLDHVFKDTRHFREAQIRQKADYSIELWVVPTQDDTASDEAIALRELRESGCDVPVCFRYVDSIPKTKAGKLRFVISEVG